MRTMFIANVLEFLMLMFSVGVTGTVIVKVQDQVCTIYVGEVIL